MAMDHEAAPDDIDALKAALIIARAEARAAEAEATEARARHSQDQAMIAHLKLTIEKLNRDRYGQRSERSSRLIDQMELQLEDLETGTTEDELAAEVAASRTTSVASFTRKRPPRQPFSAHLPRERVVVPGPTSCACCGGARLAKLGEDSEMDQQMIQRIICPSNETLEVIPRQWKVIQTVREKFTWPGIARPSVSPRHHSTSRRAAGPGQACLR